MNDQDLRQNILDALDFDPSLDAANIGVAVDDGIVTLTGHVKSYTEKTAVEQAVLRVKGVHGIAQVIEVRLPASKKTADDEIAGRAIDIIAWNTTIPDDRIQVKVEDGWVTLTGNVDWQYQKIAAAGAIHRLSGVRGLSNLILVNPRPVSADIKKRIEDALKRNAQIEASGIRVDVLDGKVMIEGQVRAWYEREMIEQAAWSAPGVRSVEDRIAVR